MIETIGWIVALVLVFGIGVCFGRAWQIMEMKAQGRYYDANERTS